MRFFVPWIALVGILGFALGGSYIWAFSNAQTSTQNPSDHAEGNPTLIDFGASRAAMAGRTLAMTAIFTPGYASAEQFTSSRQGPWSDIYSLSATLYHAIIDRPPPSAMDCMLEDEHQRLAHLLPEGFESRVLLGIDAGLAVRVADRPQSIAAWRPTLGQTGPLDSLAGSSEMGS